MAATGALTLAACTPGGQVPSVETPVAKRSVGKPAGTGTAAESAVPPHLAAALLAPGDLDGFSIPPSPSPSPSPSASPASSGSSGCPASGRVAGYRKPPLRPTVEVRMNRYQPVTVLSEALTLRRIEDARTEVGLEADAFRECHRLLVGEYTGDQSPLAFPKFGDRTVAGRVATTVLGLRENTDLVYVVHPKGIVISLAIMTLGDAADSDVAQQVARVAYRKVDDFVAGR
ncbi:hypothetical protein [Streptomyces sp. NBC_00989]|uniref:hypothetical protein n=1 Tax=Streptomyces sp. NBC_00989 TaxID=2903705 RepID=UPI00386E2580|nr:hypothetical protein OG714_07450 [Streptomyces sp. NBC_00989]